MKKVRIPLMIQDHKTAQDERLDSGKEGYEVEQEFFLDGPVSEKVAVIDFDPKTGTIESKLKFGKKGDEKKGYCYCDKDGKDVNQYKGDELYSPEFMQISTFATVLKTIELFEKHNTLGRPIKWAFPAKQLVVIPRAGKMANAFYNRDTNTLEFFYFDSISSNQTIYSCLSREIVAHEAGHAIIDGIAPDLMNAYTPDSLAIHEALADVVALFLSFGSNKLTKLILEENTGSIREQSHFTRLAEEFGDARGYEDGLRNFLNDKNLKIGDEDYIGSFEPHKLSEVLSGTIYKLLIKKHESEKKRLATTKRYAKKPNSLYSASGYALVSTTQEIKKVLFRGLDYLPPGEITFADYGRAIVVADRLENKLSFVREWFAKEFMARGITNSKEALLMRKKKPTKIFKALDIPQLLQKRLYAYNFILDNRALIYLPATVSNFEIRDCYIAEYPDSYKKTGKKVCILKIAWNIKEANPLNDRRLPNERWIQQGTTMVIEIATKKLVGLLSNAAPCEEFRNQKNFDYERRKKEYQNTANLRTNYLQHLIAEENLKLGRDLFDADDKPLSNGVHGNVVDNALQIQGSFNALHLCN